MKKKCNWMMMGPMMPMMMWNMAMARSCKPRKACSTGTGSTHDKTAKHEQDEPLMRDIVDIAVEAGFFSRLVEAVQAAGLVETLKSEGPFTVFAPTDEAFAKVPRKVLESALNDPEKLRAILTFHVVPGRYAAGDLGGINSLRTVQGTPLEVDTSVGVKVGGAHVIKADLSTSNGVIHVIDSVLMP
jgi:uncharacterized surface protein with fasciclin (FAS1) repeats